MTEATEEFVSDTEHHSKVIYSSLKTSTLYKWKKKIDISEEFSDWKNENVSEQDFYNILLIFATKLQDIKLLDILINKIDQPEQLFNTYQNLIDSVLFTALSHRNANNSLTAQKILSYIKNKNFDTKATLLEEHIDAIVFSLNLSPNPKQDLEDFVLPFIDSEGCNKIIGGLCMEEM